MKKLITVLLIFIALPLYSSSLSMGFDLMSFDSFIFSNIGIRTELSYKINDEIRLSTPLNYYAVNNENIYLKTFNTGLFFDYFPFFNLGFYTGVSLIDYYYIYGYDAPKDNHQVASNLRFGYVFTFPYFSLDLRFSIFDVVCAVEDSSAYLSSVIRQLAKYKFSIVASFTIDFGKIKK